MRTVKSLSVLAARGERFCELVFEALEGVTDNGRMQRSRLQACEELAFEIQPANQQAVLHWLSPRWACIEQP